MTDAIGRGDYILGADFSEVREATKAAEQDIQQSGKVAEETYERAGQRAGELFKRTISVGLTAVATVAAAAFAVAGRGLVELEGLQADFRAETGATADEADRAGDAINRMSGRNIQPMREIGAALTKVHTDLGLTGAEAEATTELFLRFARATRQDAAASVLAFDDILDAWGLTAADSGRLMDQLVKSHQLYGGSIEGNQQALAKLAPQLKGLNLTIDDGIGLLNLFASSGLDASQAQFALNSAIQRLPKGESLKEFIARLATIEDDGERAAAAIEVFGARGGAGLANAIKPGVSSLEDFIVTAEEATGATEEAAKALDSTFGARVQLLVKQFGSTIVNMGREIGPVFTLLGGIGSAAGALGFDKLIAKFGPAFVARMREVGANAGEALIDGVGTATGAAGTVIGNFFASRIENVLDPTRNTLLGRIVRAAGAKIAIIQGAAIAAGTWLSDALVSVWNRTGLSGPVRAAVLAASVQLGTLSGTAMGTAMGVAARAAFLLAIAAIASAIAGPVQDLGKSIGDAIRPSILTDVGNAWKQWRENAPWPIGQQGAPDWARLGGETQAGAAAIAAALNPAATEIAATMMRARDGIDSIPRATQGAVPGTQEGSSGVGAAIKTIGEAASDAAVRVVTATLSIEGNILAMRDRLVAGAQASANAIFDPIIEKNRLAALETQKSNLQIELSDAATTKARKREIRAQITEIDKQLFIQESVVASHGDATARIADEKAKLQRVLVELQAKGLNKDQRALLEARAREHRSNIAGMERDAAAGGKDIRDGFIGPLAKMPGQTRTIARNTRGALSGSLSDIPTYGWGARAARRFAEGLESMQHAVNQAASRLAGAVGDYLKVSSPSRLGPFSEGGGPEGWARRFVMLYRSEFERLAGGLGGLLHGAAAELRASVTPTPFLPTAALAPAGAGQTIHNVNAPVNAHVTVNLALPAGFTGTEADIRELMRRIGNEAHLSLIRTPASFTPNG